MKMVKQSMILEKENFERKFFIYFRPAGTRAVRRFVPMMWIDQVNKILSFSVFSISHGFRQSHLMMQQ